MKVHDLIFVDTETTGLNPLEHEIIEIALVRVRQTWDKGEQYPKGTPVGLPSRCQFELIEEWSTKILPENIATANPDSLRVTGYTVTGWKDAISCEDAMREFAARTEGGIMVAHNVAFDSAFIDATLSKYGIKNPMHYHRLDTVSMAYAVLHSTPDVGRYSLAELCKHFGIVNENAHSALADAKACFELFKKLIEL